MNKRQTTILVLAVSGIFILGIQTYQLIRHDISSAAPTKATPVTIPTIDKAPHFTTQLPKAVIASRQRFDLQRQQYIELVNQYELAKVQRQLLDEEVAIAAAQQRIAELNQKTKKLIISDNDVSAPSVNEPHTTTAQNSLPADLNTINHRETHATVEETAYSPDEALLLDLPPMTYTIQLKTADDRNSLLAFATKNKLGSRAIIYSTSLNHEIHFFLIYHYYNTKTEALKALRGLPEALRELHPSVQPVIDIQRAIRSKTE